MTDFDDLIAYCVKIGEDDWAKDLIEINEDSTIEDFGDLECHLSDHDLVDYRQALISKVAEYDDLTEYQVEITVARKGSCYVMAKDNEDAVRIFEKKLEHGYDEDKSISWFDFDDEFKVDGDEQNP